MRRLSGTGLVLAFALSRSQPCYGSVQRTQALHPARGGPFARSPLSLWAYDMHFQQVIEGMIGPALLMVFGACAKYLRDISRDLNDVKTAIVLTKDRLDAQGSKLNDHDLRLRDLESAQARSYVS